MPISTTATDQCVIRKVRSGAVAIPDGNAIAEGEVLQLLHVHNPDTDEAAYRRVIERKTAALGEHKSQLEHTDFIHKALGLSAQRSLYLDKGARHGEAFCDLAKD